MDFRKLIGAAAALALLLSLLLAWFLPSVGDMKPENPFWNGLRDFSRRPGVAATASLAVLDDPQAQVLVTIPYIPYENDEMERIKRFVNAGGVLAILDDFGQGNRILDYLGLSARFSKFTLLDPLLNFKDAKLTRVIDFDGRIKDKGLKTILLNRATTLVEVPQASVLAWSSLQSFVDFNGNGIRDEGEPLGRFPVAEELTLGKGRVVLISDSSILINSMINKEDNYRFIQEILSLGKKQVIIYGSSIPSRTLDRAKQELSRTRRTLASPYIEVALVSGVLVFTLRPIWTKRTKQNGNGGNSQAA